MILLDTNVLIYAQTDPSPLREWSSAVIADGIAEGGAAINPVILAELCVGEVDPQSVLPRLRHWGVTFLDLKMEVGPLAAMAYARYLNARRSSGFPGGPRTPLPDFLIGAQASLLGLPLATADQGRYLTYFPEVRLIVPETSGA